MGICSSAAGCNLALIYSKDSAFGIDLGPISAEKQGGGGRAGTCYSLIAKNKPCKRPTRKWLNGGKIASLSDEVLCFVVNLRRR